MLTPTKLTEYTSETSASTKQQKVWKQYSNSLKKRKHSSNSLKKEGAIQGLVNTILVDDTKIQNQAKTWRQIHDF